MSSQGYPSAPFPPPADGRGVRIQWWGERPLGLRAWLNVVLLVMTLATTTVIGAQLAHNFRHNLPAFDLERDLEAFGLMVRRPRLLLLGLPFSLTLMGILLAHELGHYVTCRRYRIDASLPYFLPAPTFIGTLGAFIRIRSPIYSKKILFDVGAAGPIAGFVCLLPALVVGLMLSKTVPGIAHRGDLVFGTPPILKLLEMVMFPGTPPGDIYLHPVARAAWVGVFATALNLLPIGQLDGGHILYAFFGDRHKLLSRIFLAALVPIGVFFWYGWLFWAVLLFFFGMRHPAIYDAGRLDPVRRKLGWITLLLFALSFSLEPIAAPGRY